MDKLLNSIETRIKYIIKNSENAFVEKTCNIIRVKLEGIKARQYTTEGVVNSICDNIINNDIDKMKRVLGLTNMTYKKMDELSGFINDIRSAYFEEN